MPPRQTRTKRSFRVDANESTLSFPTADPPTALPAAEPPGEPAAESQRSKRALSRARLVLLLVGVGCVGLVLASPWSRAAPTSGGVDGQGRRPASAPAKETAHSPMPPVRPTLGASPTAGSESPAAPTTAPSVDQAPARDHAAGSSAPARPDAPAASRARTRKERPSRPAAVEAPGADEADRPSIRTLLDEAASAFVLGQIPRARILYQQVLERQPSQPDAWRGLGLTASRMGQRKDAERAFEQYLKLRPDAADAARIREQLEKLR